MKNKSTTYWQDKLADYLADQVRNHGLIDFKCCNLNSFGLEKKLTEQENNQQVEKSAKAIYETFTGKRKCVDITHKKI